MSAARDLSAPQEPMEAWTLEIDGVVYGLESEAVQAVKVVDSEGSPSSWQTSDGPVPRVSLGGLLSQRPSNAAFAVVVQDPVGTQVALTVPLRPIREAIDAQTVPTHLGSDVRGLVHAVGARPDGSSCLVLDTEGIFDRVRAHRRRAFRIVGDGED